MFVKSATSGNFLPAKIIKKSFIRKLFLLPYILIEYIGSDLKGKCKRTQWYKPSNIIISTCDLHCEYPQCDNEFHGDDIETAIDLGWQHGYDASFCPNHNV